MSTNVRSRSLLAMAGVTAGVASIGLAPTGASAAAPPTLPAVQPGDGTMSPLPSAPAPTSHGPCQGATTFNFFTSTGGNVLTRVAWPTTAHGSEQVHCTMRQGMRGDGVNTLQVAIVGCYPELRGLIGPTDGIYGPRTRDAVKKVQGLGGATVDGVYGPETWGRMEWPMHPVGGGSAICLTPFDERVH